MNLASKGFAQHLHFLHEYRAERTAALHHVELLLAKMGIEDHAATD